MIVLFLFLICSHGGLEDASCAKTWSSGNDSPTFEASCGHTLDSDLSTGFTILGSSGEVNNGISGDDLTNVQV
jgi:hypothetical protein